MHNHGHLMTSFLCVRFTSLPVATVTIFGGLGPSSLSAVHVPEGFVATVLVMLNSVVSLLCMINVTLDMLFIMKTEICITT